MKHILMILLAAVSLVACATTTPTQTTASNTATVPPVARITPTATSTNTTVNYAAEEAEVRDLVENFGKRLQVVSLQSPDTAQEIQKHYSKFATPALLEIWMKDVSKAPGRIVSSPWPDHIEITSLSKEGSDRYEMNGFVVELTSLEVVNGGAAAKIPIHIIVQNDQGRWLITEYAEEN